MVLVAGATQASIDGQTYYGNYDLLVEVYFPNGTRMWTKMTGTSGNDHTNDVIPYQNGLIHNGYWNGVTSSAYVTYLYFNGSTGWNSILPETTTEYRSLQQYDGDSFVYTFGDQSGTFNGKTSTTFDPVVTRHFVANGSRDLSWFIYVSNPTDADTTEQGVIDLVTQRVALGGWASTPYTFYITAYMNTTVRSSQWDRTSTGILFGMSNTETGIIAYTGY